MKPSGPHFSPKLPTHGAGPLGNTAVDIDRPLFNALKAAGKMGPQGWCVFLPHMRINSGTTTLLQMKEHSKDQLLGKSPATVLWVCLQRREKQAVPIRLYPQSAHIFIRFQPDRIERTVLSKKGFLQILIKVLLGFQNSNAAVIIGVEILRIFLIAFRIDTHQLSEMQITQALI